MLAKLPQIPCVVHDSLVAEPTDQEVLKALMQLGPNKSPGPDGFNAKTIQDNWNYFGPAVMNEVLEIFRTGHMSSQVARSNLVLVPKIEKATEVTHFRPISVCNVIYKLISKIISIRIRPFIGGCIVPGREISDNVILLREVLHSFKLKSYSHDEFCLKWISQRPLT